MEERERQAGENLPEPPRGWSRFALGDMVLDIPRARIVPPVRIALRSGRYERPERIMLARLLRGKSGRALDLGGGAGATGIVLARALGPENVVIVEADPQMAAVIRHNLALNGVAGAEVLPAAAVAEAEAGEDAVRFARGKAFWASAVPRKTAAGEIEVPAVGIGDLMEAYAPDIVVMDVEGMEIELTAPIAAAGPRYLLMELHRGRYGLAGVARIFGDLIAGGYAYRTDLSRGAVICFEKIG